MRWKLPEKGHYMKENGQQGPTFSKKHFLVNISRTGHFTSIKGLSSRRRLKV